MENQKNGRTGNKPPISPAEERYNGWNAFVTRIFGDSTTKERMLALVSFVLTGVIAFFAAEKGIPFLTAEAGGGISKPLGDAILCASGIYAPAAYIALIYETVRSGISPIARIIALSALFALRTGISLRHRREEINREHEAIWRSAYREPALIKLASACLFSLLTVGIRMLSLPPTKETLPELMSVLLLPPLLTALLCGAFASGTDTSAESSRGEKRIHQIYNELSTCLLFMLCVYALKGHTVVGSSLSSLAAIFLTVTAAVRCGTLRGAAVGALTGLTVSRDYAPIMTLIGTFAGVLSSLGIGAAVGISCAVGCLAAIYAYGYKALLNLVPEAIIATAITSPTLRYKFLPEGFPMGSSLRARKGGESAARHSLSVSCADALRNASSALTSIPSIASKTSDSSPLPDSSFVCARLKKGFCDSCPLVCICWESGNKNAREAVKREIASLYSSVPPKMPKSIHFNCIRDTEFRRELIQICESPEAKATLLPPPTGFHADCIRISEILDDIRQRTEKENSYDSGATARAARALSAMGIGAREVTVFGAERKTAVVYGIANTDKLTERLTEVLSTACGQRLSPPVIMENEANRNSSALIFKPHPAIELSYSISCSKATGEEQNGDSTQVICTENGYFHLILCDGMGSGSEASDCSEQATNIIKRLLEGGISPRIAALLTGNSVKERQDECFTTLDLLTVDTVTGEATLRKSGAACSFLIRNGESRELTAPSLPLGISYETVPEEISFLTLDGDIIVMISDGMAEDEEEERQLSARLSLFRKSSPEEIANALISDANKEKSESPDEPRADDRTVAVIAVHYSE